MTRLGSHALRDSAPRLREIIEVFSKYGLADAVTEGWPPAIRRQLVDVDSELLSEHTPAERFRLALTELGTTFVKLGQMLSTREDLVGPEVANELKLLQADTPPDPPQTVRRTIKQELGDSPDSLFASFDDEALGSASIGQVHAAELEDGTRVVVKVQHDGIQEPVKSDLELISYLAGIAEDRSAELARYRPRSMAAEFRRTLLRELDLTKERQNIDRFRSNFADDDSVKIPSTDPDRSSSRVLTMERIEGIPLGDREALDESGIDTKEVARRGADIWMEMIFRDGYFHADPHPGNILVLPGGQIGLLDFGMIGFLDGRMREQLEDLVIAFVSKDEEDLTHTLLRICDVPRGLDVDAFRTDVGEFVFSYVQVDIADADTVGAMRAAEDLVRHHNLVLPAGMSMLGKTLIQLEGSARGLDSSFDLMEVLQPYGETIVQRRFSPERLLRKAHHAQRDWERLAMSFPGDLAEIMAGLKQGEIQIRFEIPGLQSAVNRMVHVAVGIALARSAGQLLRDQTPPKVRGVSVPGLTLAAAAGFYATQLGRAVRRTGGI